MAFFGISTCRDLLFHVQEQQTELPAIAAFLKENGLTFLGFETNLANLQLYHRRFPHDPAATDLGNGDVLENENPQLFARMYMMWVQKAGPADAHLPRCSIHAGSQKIWPGRGGFDGLFRNAADSDGGGKGAAWLGVQSQL